MPRQKRATWSQSRCCSIGSPFDTSLPAAALSRPKAKIAPRWVFTPPVASSISFSQAIPTGRSIINTCSGATAAVSWPMMKNFSIHGATTAVLASNEARSISRCAPALRISTSPGFGVRRTSVNSARSTALTTSSALSGFTRRTRAGLINTSLMAFPLCV